MVLVFFRETKVRPPVKRLMISLFSSCALFGFPPPYARSNVARRPRLALSLSTDSS